MTKKVTSPDLPPKKGNDTRIRHISFLSHVPTGRCSCCCASSGASAIIGDEDFPSIGGGSFFASRREHKASGIFSLSLLEGADSDAFLPLSLLFSLAIDRWCPSFLFTLPYFLPLYGSWSSLLKRHDRFIIKILSTGLHRFFGVVLFFVASRGRFIVRRLSTYYIKRRPLPSGEASRSPKQASKQDMRERKDRDL